VDADPLAELAAIRGVADAADLADAPRQTINWCLGRLPRLYRELAATYESRYADEIVSLAGAMFRSLADHAPASPDAAEVSAAVLARLRALHGRLNFPGLEIVPPTPAKRAPRKSG
jgi:hypothetical protein